MMTCSAGNPFTVSFAPVRLTSTVNVISASFAAASFAAGSFAAAPFCIISRIWAKVSSVYCFFSGSRLQMTSLSIRVMETVVRGLPPPARVLNRPV